MGRVQLPVVAQDAAGNAVSDASVSITNRQTGQAPAVYTTETGGAARSLPLTTGANGRPPESWVDRAAYLITVTAPAVGTDTLAWDGATARDASVDAPWLADSAVTNAKVAANAAIAESKLALAIGWTKTGVGDAGLARGAFSVFSTVATVITPQTTTVVPLAGVTFDVSAGANATGYTVPVTGVYRVTGQWRCANSLANGAQVNPGIQQNTVTRLITLQYASGPDESFMATGLIKCVAGDTLRLTVTHNGAANLSTQIGAFNTFLCGELVGRT